MVQEVQLHKPFCWSKMVRWRLQDGDGTVSKEESGNLSE